MAEVKRCRHRKVWLVESMIWCYECGAIRIKDVVWSPWFKPVGRGGENPAMGKKHYKWGEEIAIQRAEFYGDPPLHNGVKEFENELK